MKRFLKFFAGVLFLAGAVGITNLTAFADPNNVQKDSEPTTLQSCGFPKQTEALLSYASQDAVWPKLQDLPLKLANQIPAGAYRINAKSYDNHSGKNDPTQPDERWQIWAYGSDTSTPFYTSSYTDDIPDDIDTNTTLLQPYIYFNQPVQYVRYVHYAYSNGLEDLAFGGKTFDSLTPAQKATVTWQSVVPDCIDFEPVAVVTCGAVTVAQTDTPKTYQISLALNGNTTLPVQYSYDFGDGSSLASNQPVQHAYKTAGSYIITVTAKIDNTVVVACSRSITVPAGGGAVLGASTTVTATSPTASTSDPTGSGAVLGASTTGILGK